MAPRTSTSEPLSAGRVGRPHGLDGSFHVTRPDAELLEGREALMLGDRRLAVVRHAGTPQKPILRLAGCTTREAVEALRGEDLLVPRDEAPGLGEGEFWASDLEGCRVTDGPREVGVVARMVALPSCEALEVGGLLIPMVADAVRSIDLEGRRIDVDMAFLGG